MAILSKPQINSQHWYTADGVPMHEIKKVSGGGTRPTSLSDARKFGLYCSVSELLGTFSKPGLIKWQIKKAIRAALTLEKRPSESMEYFENRILEEANAEVNAAADFGTRLHDVLENYFKPAAQRIGQVQKMEIPEDLLVYCQPVIDYISERGFHFIETETIIVNHLYGFAGTLDVAFCYGPLAHLVAALAIERNTVELRKIWDAGVGIGILDYKTRKTTAGVDVKAYDNQATQIVAYGATYFATLFGVTEDEVVKRLYGANLFISSTEPGRFYVEQYTPTQFGIEWMKLIFVSAIWRLQTGYAAHKIEFPLLLQKDTPTRAMVRGITDYASEDPLTYAYDVTTPAGDNNLVNVDRLFASKDEEKKARAKAKRDAKKAELAKQLEDEAIDTPTLIDETKEKDAAVADLLKKEITETVKDEIPKDNPPKEKLVSPKKEEEIKAALSLINNDDDETERVDDEKEIEAIKNEIADDKEGKVAQLASEMNEIESKIASEPSTKPAKKAAKRVPWSEEEDDFIVARMDKEVPYKIKANVLNDKLHEGRQVRTASSYRTRENKIK